MLGIGNLAKSIFGTPNDRRVKSVRPLVQQVNALEVHRRALAWGIGVSPGPLFSPGAELTHFLRLNCANEPTPRLLNAVERSGALCYELADARP